MQASSTKRCKEEVAALACKEGLSLAAEWTVWPAIVESDCSSVIKSLNQPKTQRSTSACTIQEALDEANRLPRVVFRYVKRELNSVAHALAQLARRLNHNAVWRYRAPFCVEQLIARDINVRCFGSLAQDKTTLHTLRLELSVFVLALFLLLGRVDGPSLC